MGRLRTFLILTCGVWWVSCPWQGWATPSLREKLKVDHGELRIEGNRLTLRPMAVPIIQQDEIVAYVVCVVTLIVDNTQSESLILVVDTLPRIRDAMLISIYDLFGKTWIPSVKPDLEITRNRLYGIVKDLLGTHVTDLEIRNFSMHLLEKKQKTDATLFSPPSLDDILSSKPLPSNP